MKKTLALFLSFLSFAVLPSIAGASLEPHSEAKAIVEDGERGSNVQHRKEVRNNRQETRRTTAKTTWQSTPGGATKQAIQQGINQTKEIKSQ